MISAGRAFQRLLATLDKLEIRYAVGGSVASSIRGNYRLTNDVDILVDMPLESVESFGTELGDEFHADPPMIAAAFARGRICKVIHKVSAFKFDLIPAGKDEFARAQLEHSSYESSEFFGEPVEFAVTSAEDIILAKLRWHKLSGESQQQWRDAVGIAVMHRNKLDRAYLDRWARQLGVSDMLEKLWADSAPTARS